MTTKKNIASIVCLSVALFLSNSTRAQTFVSNTDESKVPAYTLPDVLLMQNGRKLKTAAEWNKVQRPYIYQLYEENQFGTYPKIKTAIRYKILESDSHVFKGTATRKQVRIYLHPTDTSVYTDLLMYIPHSKKPVPVFVGYNFSGNQSIQSDPSVFISQAWIAPKTKGVVNNRATENSRGNDTATQWPVKEILSHGFAVATAYYGDIEPDHPEGWKTGIRTTMKDVLNIQPEQWSAMGAWAYGLSRIMDYLQKDKTIDGKKVALMGHSRLGKAALWAGASDQRFALVVSNESGEGGATLSKRWYGETVKIINEKFPHWFSASYKTYGDNTAALPIDGHMLLSLIAPRPLYVASAEGDQWSDPKGEFLSAKEAGRVYSLFGKKGIDTDKMPGLHQPVGATVRYHIRAGKHDVTLYDWQQYLKFAEAQFK
ncbi:MAG: hypothetical protein JWN76_2590 [Chitinophagaceae bacterium]|nr:hypothetical protein [Chitinophagaceae bacterium]